MTEPQETPVFEGETFEDTPETATPTAPSADTKPTETAAAPSTAAPQADVKPQSVPFHEDPKIQEYINRQVESRVQGLRVELKPTEAPRVELPSWWGGDEKQWTEFQAHLSTLEEKAAQRAISQFKSEQEQQKSAIESANAWFQSSINDLKSSGETIDDNTVNRILKKAEEEQLIDSQGRWNYKAAWKLLKAEDTAATPKPNVDEKKQIAGASTAPQTEPEKRSYKTSDDFRGKKPW
jgi:hypothetical protein